jgi:hypothetical protein
MKTMTVSEIMVCGIPEGDYTYTLFKLRAEIHLFVNSFHLGSFESNLRSMRLSFTALYALAQGEYMSKADVMKVISDEPKLPRGHDVIISINHFLQKMNELPTIGTKEV